MFTLQTLYKDLKRLFSYYALLILDNKVLLHDAEKKNNVFFGFMVEWFISDHPKCQDCRVLAYGRCKYERSDHRRPKLGNWQQRLA